MRNNVSMLNSAMLMVLLALGGWTVKTLRDTEIGLATFIADQRRVNQERMDANTRIETQLGNITREIDLLKQRLSALENRR
jgi:hypothetical protein